LVNGLEGLKNSLFLHFSSTQKCVDQAARPIFRPALT
jgi:hypothetical protein